MARHTILRHAGTAMLVTAVGLALFAFPTDSLGGGLPAGVNTARRQVPPASTTIEVPIAASSDDAGINAAWDWCTYGTNHNEIYFGQCADGADITSGFRFNPVAIPRGAHIVEAYIRFTVDGPYTGAMTVRFGGEASGNAQPFDDVSRPDNRPLIPNAMSDWQITPTDPWTLGETRNSPPLTAIVQAIADRSDWSSGNALAIITQNVGTATGNWRHRRVIGYERPVWYPGTEYAARLVVTYDEQPPSPSPAADWSTMGGQEGAQMGRAATGAGDVNGDGYDDLLVGVERYDNGQVDEGRVYLFYGSATGLASQPAWSTESNVAGAVFGYSASTAGDVNGDGYADVIIGAPGHTNGEANEGRAYLYLGSLAGLAATPAWMWESNQSGANIGQAASTAGDINGDGYADVIIGAPHYSSGQAGEGKAFVFYGSPAGLGSTPNWTAESDQAGAAFGCDAGTAGDVNGDGYADVIVGALYYDNGQTDEGRAFVYLGSASGLASTASWTAESDQDGAKFGVSASTAGDVNGDGYADVVVGAYLYDSGQTDAGRAFVYLGSATGLNSTYSWMAEGDQPSAAFGMSSTTAGDVNGDGYADLFVTAPWYNGGQYQEGRAYVYYGSASGLQSTPAWTAEGNQYRALLGYSWFGHADDVNGDGYADIVVGALWYDGGQTDEGAAFVYHGAPTSAMAVSLTSFEAASRSGQTPGLPVAAMLILALVALGAQLRKGARGGHAWLACFW